MIIPELKMGQAVELDWVDSKSALGWTYNLKLKRTPGYIRSLGYVIQATDECLTITTSLGERGESIDDFSIPVGCITRIEVLPAEWSVNGPEPEGV